MRRVQIDEQVYAKLGEHAVGFETPNDVLRRLLLDVVPGSPNGADHGDESGSEGSGPGVSATSLPGALAFLLAAGVVKPGDRLVHRQVRKGRVFSASVDEEGYIRTDRGHYRHPSPALRDLVETQIDGWAYWTHEPSGKALRRLRDENGGKPRGRR